MINEQFDIPECELVLSRKTFSENPIGFKAFLYSTISLLIAVLYVLFSYFLTIGSIYHFDLLIIGRMAGNSNETVLREPGVILISTKALILAMPAMTILFSIISMSIIIKEKIHNRGTGLFAFAFAFSYFAIILIIIYWQMPIDMANYLWDAI
jgi:hypothetical protein